MAGKKRFSVEATLIVLALGIGAAGLANPTLTPGVWTDITPSYLKGTSFQTCGMNFDPSNRNALYLTGSFGSKLGLVKSTDGGSSWARVGNPPAATNWGDTVDYLDAPYQIAVDPANSQHMYCTEMSPGGGATLGFWVTTNGGAKWIRPKGFMDAVAASNGSTDVGHFDIDPTDFNHVLVCSHYYWSGNGASGIYETKDGGNTFIVHYPGAGMGSASKAPVFLYNPALALGDPNTWLVVEDMSGIFRTTDAGAHWAQVSTLGTPHGGTSSHVYTKAGVLYIGGGQTMLRSNNNGATWESVPNTSTHMYYAVGSDGNKIYIGGSGAVSSPWSAWFTSPETDGNNWIQCPGPTAPDGITDMHYDSINHIMYSANATAGIWALKVIDASTTNVVKASAAAVNRSALAGKVTRLMKTGVSIRTTTGSIFDIRGRNIRAR